MRIARVVDSQQQIRPGLISIYPIDQRIDDPVRYPPNAKPSGGAAANLPSVYIRLWPVTAKRGVEGASPGKSP
jgi:hypothetical protein